MANQNKTSISPGQQAAQFFPQLWCLIVSVMVFAVYVGWDLRLFQQIAVLDKSYMASLIVALVCMATVYCGWHILQNSRHLSQIERWLDKSVITDGADSALISRFIKDLNAIDQSQASHADAIVEINADKARTPVDLGWFFVDLAIRLGLLGTIIGFILIFSSLSTINIDGGDDLKNLLIAMSGGMGTALLTTLSGLIGASLLSFQFLILGRQSEHLVGMLLRIRNRMVVAPANQSRGSTSQ